MRLTTDFGFVGMRKLDCWIYEGEIEKSISNYLKNQKILVDDKIDKIVGIMIDYIEKSGGFLEQ